MRQENVKLNQDARHIDPALAKAASIAIATAGTGNSVHDSDLEDLELVDSSLCMTEDTSGSYVSVTPVNLKQVSVDEVNIPKITDTTGRLSESIKVIEQETSSAVIPLEITKVLPQCSELAEHDILTYKGKRFASSREIRPNVIAKLKATIIESLTAGLAFRRNLWTTIDYKGNTYDTLELSLEEQSLICAMFKSYNSGVYRLQNDEKIELVIGERVC